MAEKWPQSLGKGGNYRALLTLLTLGNYRFFDCLSHDLLITKLHTYGVDIPALRLLYNYLTDRKQCVKIDCTFSS